MLTKTIEGESIDPVRANIATDSPRDLFPIDVCTNISCTSPGVPLLVSMARLGKSPKTFLYFSLAGLLVHMIS